ncbi:recombinase RecT [Shewanella sp. SG44-6]|jgi:recombinational DNA repair protein RecT|uniref:recombinase RecT n=1 Tax=Shewanella sp. SG44-6 TaxID=2760959 RepID=UPI001603AD67|nr:recombinase RecT [Shewanella sp. SG44-6]MBB1390218.1 recombinase RecT [Shewanella sp. SG44-6]
MTIKKADWLKLIKVGGVSLIMKDEKLSALDCFECAGFNREIANSFVDYCLAYAAVTGLTWSETSSYLYPSVDRDSGNIFIAHTYRADCQLAYAKGGLQNIQAWAIREGDEVLIGSGDNTAPSITQTSLSPDRGAIKGGVASGTLKCGTIVNAFIKKEEILKTMSNGTAVWSSVFVDEMIKKSAIWQILNNIPNLKRELSIYVDKYCNAYYPKLTDSKGVSSTTTKPMQSVSESVSLIGTRPANSKKYQSTGLVYQTPTLLKFMGI